MLKPLAGRTAATRAAAPTTATLPGRLTTRAAMAQTRRGRRGTASSHHYVLSGILPLVRPTIKGCEGRSGAAFFGLAMTAEVGPSNAGTTFTALVTKADGVIVNSSGMFYTFAGGRAFGITTTARPAGDPED